MTTRIESTELKKALKKIKPFMGNGNYREYLNGVYVEFIDSDKISLTATDGIMLLKIELSCKVHEGFDPYIIPEKDIDRIIKILPAARESSLSSVVIEKDEGRVSFKFPDYVYCFDELNREFPDYRKLIPKKTGNNSEVLNNKFVISAIKSLGDTSINISQFKEGEPYVLTNDNGSLCLIMPKKGETK